MGFYETFEFVGWFIIILLIFVCFIVYNENHRIENGDTTCRPIDWIMHWECDNKKN